MIEPPQKILEVLEQFDNADSPAVISHVYDALLKCIKRSEISDAEVSGWWAELVAFIVRPTRSKEGSVWGTYFSPMLTQTFEDGTVQCNPDIHEGTQDTIEYWKLRAEASRNWAFKARYNDLVWDFERLISGSNPDIKYCEGAIENYLSIIKAGRVEGDHLFRNYIERSIVLSSSISNEDLLEKSCKISLNNYLNSPEQKYGELVQLMELFISGKCKSIPDVYRNAVIELADESIKEIETSRTQDSSPHKIQTLGLMLAKHAEKKSDHELKKMYLLKIANANERRGDMDTVLGKLHFFEEARRFYHLAGDKIQADRMHRLMQNAAPQAKEQMQSHTVEFTVSDEKMKQFDEAMIKDTVSESIVAWAVYFLPNIDQLKEFKAEQDKANPISAIIGTTVISDHGVVAEIKDTNSDEEGPMINFMASQVQYQTPLLRRGLSVLAKNGVSKDELINYYSNSPLFNDADSLAIMKKSMEHCLRGDYLVSAHLMIPQIERAIVRTLDLLGKSSAKSVRGGRGVMQAKNINDALGDDDVKDLLSPSLAMYLISMLSHPKGLNMRNLVCHGLLESSAFTELMCARLVHLATCLSLIQYRSKD